MKKNVIFGIEVEYIMENSGKPLLLFIHGYESSLESFANTIKDKGRDFDLIALNLPGSRGSSFKGEVSIEFYAEIVKEFIHKLNLNSITLMGHSMGGAIATIISKEPEIRNTILLNPLNPFSYVHASRKIPILKEVKKMLSQKKGSEHVETFFKLLNFGINYKKRNKFLIKNQFLSKRYQSEELALHYALAKNLHPIGYKDDNVIPVSSLIETFSKTDTKPTIFEQGGHSPFKTNPEEIIEIINSIVKK